MKQFLSYLLYVGILFVLQMPFLLVRGLTDTSAFWKSGIGAFFEAIFLIIYMVPGAVLYGVALLAVLDPILVGLGVGTDNQADLETRGWLGGILLWLAFAVVALIYALVIGAILWGITYIINRIRHNALKP